VDFQSLLPTRISLCETRSNWESRHISSVLFSGGFTVKVDRNEKQSGETEDNSKIIVFWDNTVLRSYSMTRTP
jgi:hypothetical protein